jgi:hypothetical protein
MYGAARARGRRGVTDDIGFLPSPEDDAAWIALREQVNRWVCAALFDLDARVRAALRYGCPRCGRPATFCRVNQPMLVEHANRDLLDVNRTEVWCATCFAEREIT